MPISRILLSLAAALATTIAVAPSAAAQAPAKISIAIGAADDFLPAFVAKDKEIFLKHGLDVTFVVAPAPPMVPPMLVSKSVQIGFATPPNFLLACEGGLDLVAIQGAARLLRSNPKISLVTRAGVTVKEAADLKGKKIGVPGFNSIIEMFLRKWLINHAVPRADVTLVEAPLLQMGDLLKSGQLDGATPIEPIRGRMIAAGAGSASVDFFSEVNPDVLGSFWMASRDWAVAHKSEVAAFRAAIAEGLAFVTAHTDEAKAIEKKVLGFADPSLSAYALKLEVKDFDYVQKLEQELGVSRQTLDVSKLILE